MHGFQIGRCYKRQLIMFPLHDVLSLCNLEYLPIISRTETHLLITPYSQFIAGILVVFLHAYYTWSLSVYNHFKMMSHSIYMVRTHTEERCLCKNKVACAEVRSEVGRKLQKAEDSILGDWSPNLTLWGLLWFLRLHHSNKYPTRAPSWRCWAKNNLESSICFIPIM